MKTIDDNTLARSIRRMRNTLLLGITTILTIANTLSYSNTNQLIQNKTLTPQQIKDTKIVELLATYDNSNFYQKRMNINCNGIGYFGSQLAAENAQSNQFWEQREQINGRNQ